MVLYIHAQLEEVAEQDLIGTVEIQEGLGTIFAREASKLEQEHDHSVSKPIMVGGNNASQAASPRSESYGPGVLQMVVDNVLSGSPASVNTKHFVNAAEERCVDAFCGAQITPYLVQGGHVIGGTTTLPMQSKNSGTGGYGYGSWSTVYPTSHALTTPSNIENSQNGESLR
ncbi:hypothetical protein COOONC_19461 [Cooperia oncophora]